MRGEVLGMGSNICLIPQQLGVWGAPTGAGVIENNEASAKLTTANGGTFT